MKVSKLLGVPHAQVNAYIQRLVLYRIRVAHGHDISSPPIPNFILNQEPICERKPKPLEKAAPRTTTTTMNSVHTDNNHNLPQAMALGVVQTASMFAHKYAALMLEDAVGDTTKKTEPGDVKSVKTHGWKMCCSEQIVNPLRLFSWEHSTSNSQTKGEKEAKLVYMSISNTDTEITLLESVAKKMGTEPSSTNPNEALACSSWLCAKAGAEDGHDAKLCKCDTKTKKLLVCAVDEGEEERLLPIRIETFVWKPKSVEEARA